MNILCGRNSGFKGNGERERRKVGVDGGDCRLLKGTVFVEVEVCEAGAAADADGRWAATCQACIRIAGGGTSKLSVVEVLRRRRGRRVEGFSGLTAAGGSHLRRRKLPFKIDSISHTPTTFRFLKFFPAPGVKKL